MAFELGTKNWNVERQQEQHGQKLKMDKSYQHTAVLFVIHNTSLKLNSLIKTKTNFSTCLPDVRVLWRQLVTLLKNKIDFQLPIKMKIFS